MKSIYNYITKRELRKKIREALKEDIKKGDITTSLFFDKNEKGKFHLISKEKGVLCGKEVFTLVFREIDKDIRIKWFKEEGEEFKKNEKIAEIKGRIISILKGERVALNFISHLSGISTMTRKMVKLGKGIMIRDTRKTIPLLRALQKYAINVGGGYNHRMSLSEGIMVKDNHKKLAGFKKILEVLNKKKLTKKAVVEVENLKELKLAVEKGIKYIILDNMNIEKIKEAVKLARGKVFIEVSGGVDFENIRELSKTGINGVSCGFLTHSVKAIDFSLEAKRRI